MKVMDQELKSAVDLFINERVFETHFEEGDDPSYSANEKRIGILMAALVDCTSGALREQVLQLEKAMTLADGYHQINCYKRGFKDAIALLS